MNISSDQLRRAAQIKDKLESLQGDLDKILGGSYGSPSTAPKGKRKMSAGAKAKIAAAQRARWAKVRAAKK